MEYYLIGEILSSDEAKYTYVFSKAVLEDFWIGNIELYNMSN